MIIRENPENLRPIFFFSDSLLDQLYSRFEVFPLPLYNCRMLARYDLKFRHQTPHLTTRPSTRPRMSGRLMIGILTAVYLLWLFVRLFSRPDWLAHLPPTLDELLRLAEIAGLMTLTLLWLLWWWRGQQKTAVTVQPLDIEELYALNPYEFERYVADLFRRKGYRVKLRGRRGDNGVDLMLTQTNGKRAIVQCKRYRNSVGPDIVRELYGTLIHERVAHAFLVTTADISHSARTWAQGKPMTLIDGTLLAHLAAVFSDR